MDQTPVRSASAKHSVAIRRLAFLIAGFLIAVLIFEMWLPIMTLWDDIHVPYAVNFWSEPPLFVQIHRIAAGRAAYLAPYTADSWTYGPFYGYLLATIDRIFERRPSIVVLRMISVYIGYAAMLPLVLSLIGARLRRSRTAGWASTVLAACLTVTLFAILDMRSISFTALHPDVVAYVIVATAIAVVVWYPLTRHHVVLLAILCLFCFIGALTKLNLAPLIAFFVAALVIQGYLGWRVAAGTVVGFVVAIGLFYLVAPAPLREWTLVIPAHHWYALPNYTLPILWRDVSREQVYQGYVLIATIAALAYFTATARAREAAAWACILVGVFAAGYQGFAKQGGGTNDLWMFFAACLVPTGVAVDELLGGWQPVLKLILARIVVLGYIGALTTAVLTGFYVQQALPDQGRAALERSASRLAALCKPGRTIIVTWFVDPFIDCPYAQFSTWDGVGEILTARGHGYPAKMFLDFPIGADTLITYRPFPVPHRFSLPHVRTKIEEWDGFAYGYTQRGLDVWTAPGAVKP